MVAVVDASVALTLALAEEGPAPLEGHDLLAPPLLWSEAISSLHQLRWRGEVSEADAAEARRVLDRLPIERKAPDDLQARAWDVAERLGWAKTYDAEYGALAELYEVPLVTLDGRLQRGAARLVRAIAPGELTAAVDGEEEPG